MVEGNGNPLQYSCLENPMDRGAWRAAVHGVARNWTRLSDFTFTFHFHALEKAMATHSSVFAWRIPGTGEPGELLSLGLHRVGHDWSDLAMSGRVLFNSPSGPNSDTFLVISSIQVPSVSFSLSSTLEIAFLSTVPICGNFCSTMTYRPQVWFCLFIYLPLDSCFKMNLFFLKGNLCWSVRERDLLLNIVSSLGFVWNFWWFWGGGWLWIPERFARGCFNLLRVKRL